MIEIDRIGSKTQETEFSQIDDLLYQQFSNTARLGGSHLIWCHVATCVMLRLFVL